jgi:hypothetical protein
MPEKRRWKGLSSVTQSLLDASPDEHTLLEFKEIPKVVTPDVLATLANAVALEDRSEATILVGVRERRDPKLKAVSAEVVGVKGDLHNHAELIHQQAAHTQPIPVKVEVFEENVDVLPILRVVVAPTSPPHYDQKGQRSTRQGTTTRAMRDEELLRLFEAREQGRFSAVAEQTAGRAVDAMMGDFSVIQQEQAEQLERLQLQGEEAGVDSRDNLELIRDRIDDVEDAVHLVPQQVDPSDPDALEHVWSRPRGIRQNGAYFVADRLDDVPEDIADGIQEVLNTDADVHDYVRNRAELAAWEELFPILVEGSPEDVATAAGSVITARLGEPLSTSRVDLRELQKKVEQMKREPRRAPAKRRARRRTAPEDS